MAFFRGPGGSFSRIIPLETGFLPLRRAIWARIGVGGVLRGGFSGIWPIFRQKNTHFSLKKWSFFSFFHVLPSPDCKNERVIFCCFFAFFSKNRPFFGPQRRTGRKMAPGPRFLPPGTRISAPQTPEKPGFWS